MLNFTNPVVTALVVISVLVGQKVLNEIVERFFKKTIDADYVTTTECQEIRDRCEMKKTVDELKVSNTHDNDEMKGHIEKLHEKTNCIDRKVAKLVGAFESRGWIVKE
jgi:predicted nucleic acid-binding protein